MTTYDDWGCPVSSPRDHLRGSPAVMQRTHLLVTALLVRAGIHNPYAPAGNSWARWPIFSVPNLLAIVWLFLLYSHERSDFLNSIASCSWGDWETWPADAVPHRLVFVADPQLVDPHTYPGRPWPLSTLTVAYTDQYLRRSWTLIQKDLYPDTVFFLGDLFDGGREWTADGSVSEERQWKKYGDSFWLREYDRFGRIFFGHWADVGVAPRPGQPGRKLIAGLPGNHDLGFATGIRQNVRKRFNAYFGDGNRIDVIANHTFVSIDAVSLSALGHAAGSEDIWKPTQDFLDQAQAEKRRAVARELRAQKGLSPIPLYEHAVVGGQGIANAKLSVADAGGAEFPTVLLSHVPLYRSEGTPCGPLREHWPPTEPPDGQSAPVVPDERNAIAVRGGYQYQNVLTKDVSKDVTERIGNIEYAFSGDDHDYCEVLHKGYQSGGHGGIREITVKSLSWAMGVRKPGFVMLSLWNPVDDAGQSLHSDPTIQSHLCLMPDQLGTFISYAILFATTLFILTMRALFLKVRALSHRTTPPDATILPLADATHHCEKPLSADALSNRTDSVGEGTSSNSSTTSPDYKIGLSARSAAQLQPQRGKQPSPALVVGDHGYGLPMSSSASLHSPATPKTSLPLVAYAGFYPSRVNKKTDRENEAVSTKPTRSRRKPGEGVFRHELGASMTRVAVIVLTWYFWLIWRW